MQIYENFEDRKKVNLKDDPVAILRNAREKDKNRITRKSGRNTSEIIARYQQALERYGELMRIDDDKSREQRAMLYSEVKALGWVLCYNEKAVIQDISVAVKGS